MRLVVSGYISAGQRCVQLFLDQRNAYVVNKCQYCANIMQ